jgi:RNA-directed DNA polymerase
LKDRLGKFNLEVAEEKTKIISLGKNENNDDEVGGNTENGSFDFLGFTHYMGKSKNGNRRVKRKTSRKKYNASLVKCKEWLKKNRTMPTRQLMRKMKSKVQGHCNYYVITDNTYAVSNYIHEVKKLIFKWLNRRSHRKSFDWIKFNLFLKRYPLPRARTYMRIFDYGMGVAI